MNFAIKVKGSKIEHIVSSDNIVNALNKFLSFGNYLAKDKGKMPVEFVEEFKKAMQE